MLFIYFYNKVRPTPNLMIYKVSLVEENLFAVCKNQELREIFSSHIDQQISLLTSFLFASLIVQTDESVVKVSRGINFYIISSTLPRDTCQEETFRENFTSRIAAVSQLVQICCRL